MAALLRYNSVMRSAAIAFALLICTVVGFAPDLRAAAAEGTVTLIYQVSEPCPDRASFVGRVHGIAPRLEFTDRASQREGGHVAVFAKIGPSNVAGRVLVGSSPEREISGATCEDVISALALIVALTLDPPPTAAPDPHPAGATVAREGHDEPAAPRPVETTAAAQFGAPILAPPSDPEAEHRSLGEQERTEVPTKTPVRTPLALGGNRRWYWGGGARVSASRGVEAEAITLLGPGFWFEAGMRTGGALAPSLRCGAGYTVSPTVTASGVGSARFSLADARVEFSLLRFDVGAISIAPYLLGEVGALLGRGDAGGAITQPSSESRTWVALGLGLAWELPGPGGGPWFVSLGTELRHPVLRHEYVFASPATRIALLPPLELSGHLGAGVRFW